MAYPLTFNCYGTHLPGDQRGWVERARGEHRGGYRQPTVELEAYAQKRMLGVPYLLDRRRAQVVMAAIREVCAFRGWNLLAAHVRTNHVHCVLDGIMQPNRAIADFKAYASRVLNRTEGNQKRWAREGSTRTIPTSEGIRAAIAYVVDGQGEEMVVYVAPESPL